MYSNVKLYISLKVVLGPNQRMETKFSNIVFIFGFDMPSSSLFKRKEKVFRGRNLLIRHVKVILILLLKGVSH